MSNYIHLEEIDSTSNYLKKILSENEVSEGTIVVADFQTGGRGQRGNSWESEKGQNLTFSILLKPDFVSANKQFIISQIIALAIKDVLDRYADGISIKWPNDIYWNNSKICGILIENSLIGNYIQQSIAGIGININQTEFRSDASNPISLSMVTGNSYNLHEILDKITNSILFYYQLAKDGNTFEIVSLYKNALFRKNGYHFYNDGIEDFEAKINDIEPSGILVLEKPDGKIRKFAFKEVQFVL
ncbi:biotin--[acetyl-CoA-carboxylase] ligase [Dysgonomonas massiliensis]|uniref:biotin--[acetyl-CoA-carboxylase] ligase n=1 Tax=Dysgonomonas massiliensis TaxID=2040292 RepID=UPI000C79131A|nr:biotin--[acetyl-CoA-carboxylase] ligase [Dysgonomonas massiliensis]